MVESSTVLDVRFPRVRTDRAFQRLIVPRRIVELFKGWREGRVRDRRLFYNQIANDLSDEAFRVRVRKCCYTASLRHVREVG